MHEAHWSPDSPCDDPHLSVRKNAKIVDLKKPHMEESGNDETLICILDSSVSIITNLTKAQIELREF